MYKNFKLLYDIDNFYKVAITHQNSLQTVIKFRPDEIEGVVTTSLQFIPPPLPKYKYDKNGSTVIFSGRQFYEFIKNMNEAYNSDLFDDSEKNQIKDTIDHVMKQLPIA